MMAVGVAAVSAATLALIVVSLIFSYDPKLMVRG